MNRMMEIYEGVDTTPDSTRDLDETLKAFITRHFSYLEWSGTGSSAHAIMPVDINDGCISDELLFDIATAKKECHGEEFTISIRPEESTLLIYYID